MTATTDRDSPPEGELQAEFEALQERLVHQWRLIEAFSPEPRAIVVVPSLNVDLPLDSTKRQAYEERFLFLLFLLRQPRARLVYVTGQAIHPSIVDYYLDLMPGVISSHARKRLFLVSPLDASPRPLARKVLERPRMLDRIRALVPNRNRAHLVPFSTTWDDRALAPALDIPMYGCDPRLVGLGSKSAGRRLFREEGVPFPVGREDLADEGDLVRAVAEVRRERPNVRRLVVKLNEGASGGGNASLDVAGLPPSGNASEADAIRSALPRMTFESSALDYPRFLERLAQRQGIVEERSRRRSSAARACRCA